MYCRLLAFTLCFLAGCQAPPPDVARQEVARLRASLERHRPAYLKAIDEGNRLIPETLVWLDGRAAQQPRSIALAEARTLTGKWANVYFVPRSMHEQLRFDRYSSAKAGAAHQRVLSLLRRDYFELHEYQRYAQRASEATLHGASGGRLPPQLHEFRRRRRARPPFADEIGPLLAALNAGR